MIGKIFRILRTRGVRGLTYAIDTRLRGLLAGQAKSFQTYKHLFAGKHGIEIGGPSKAFTGKGIFPVYPLVGSLDNCTFGNDTIWEGHIEEGRTFRFDRSKPTGMQHIAEATEMGRIPAATYDFVLASHVLEHIANPIQALSEWKRLLKDQGVLVLILPHKDKTFDHRRPVTTLDHLIVDFKTGMQEKDLSHLSEILALHDLGRDPEAGDVEEFRRRCMNNHQNRCLHQHVFNTRLAVEVLGYQGFNMVEYEELQPYHILLVAQKTD